jgi:hypothetical protein
VQDDLRSVLGLDDDFRLRPSAVVVAAFVGVRPVVRERLASNRLVGVEQRSQDLPIDRDGRGGGLRLTHRVGRHCGNRLADVAGLVGQHLELTGADCRAHARRGTRRLEIDLLHPCFCIR